MTPRRRAAGFLVAGLVLPLLTITMLALREGLHLSSVLLLYLLITASVAAVGGIWPGILAAVVGSALGNYLFTPPYHTWIIDDAEELIALVVFIVVAVIVSTLVDVAARRGAQVERARAESASLVETDRLRAALLSAVSHDLRTPLASIKASATSLLASDVEFEATDVREFAQVIAEQTDRLNAFIGNLLDLSRVRMGALQVLSGPVELEEVVPGALADVRRPDRRAAPVEVKVPETLPRAVADPALLERVVANLIDNALTWSPVDQPVLVIGTCGDGRVELRVIDRGPGIPEDARTRVLQPFQRLGDGHADGVGLGLAVASEFVRAMDGELRIETTEGGGTTMVLRLPAAP